MSIPLARSGRTSPPCLEINKHLRETGARPTKNSAELTCIFSLFGRVKQRSAKLNRLEQSFTDITGAGRQ